MWFWTLHKRMVRMRSSRWGDQRKHKHCNGLLVTFIFILTCKWIFIQFWMLCISALVTWRGVFIRGAASVCFLFNRAVLQMSHSSESERKSGRCTNILLASGVPLPHVLGSKADQYNTANISYWQIDTIEVATQTPGRLFYIQKLKWNFSSIKKKKY